MNNDIIWDCSCSTWVGVFRSSETTSTIILPFCSLGGKLLFKNLSYCVIVIILVCNFAICWVVGGVYLVIKFSILSSYHSRNGKIICKHFSSCKTEFTRWQLKEVNVVIFLWNFCLICEKSYMFLVKFHMSFWFIIKLTV